LRSAARIGHHRGNEETPPMDVIPVIDIKGGLAVHAQGGRRDAYRPIRTPLCAGSEPADVAAGLLALFPFRCLYIADLDAIEGRTANDAAIAAIAASAPGVDLWIDSGIADTDAARKQLATERHSVVIGSESQRGTETLHALRTQNRVLLSLDFRGDAFQGPREMLEEPHAWPSRVIVMTLGRVGSGGGPDTQRVATLAARAGTRKLFGAGGVRDGADLSALAEAGAAGALVATALHGGQITAADLDRLARR
jgi:phosphoribosylformimino-5-aminoimidazole carboxamide ribotide isomerase